MKFRLVIDFEFDPGVKIVWPMRQEVKPVNSVSALLPGRVPTIEDFPANRKAVKCDNCERAIPKLEGYKNYYGAGFLCLVCQDARDLPVRV